MIEDLQPRNIGAILDRGVQIVREHFLLFIGIAAIPGLAEFAGALAAVHPRSPATDPTAGHIALVVASYGAAFVLWVAQVILQAVATAATCLAASRVNLGEPATLREALSAFASRKATLVGLGLLQGIFAGWPLIIVAFVATAMAAASTSIFVQIPVWTLGAIPCIALYCRYALAYPAAAIEGKTAHDAINRSVALSEGGRWRICWGFLVPLVPPFLLTIGASAGLEVLKGSFSILARSPMTEAAINGVVALVTNLVFTPFSAIVLTLLYYDQRIRKEGFDVERMMALAGLEVNTPLLDGQASAAGAGAAEGRL